jgi:hypothetical protein
MTLKQREHKCINCINWNETVPEYKFGTCKIRSTTANNNILFEGEAGLIYMSPRKIKLCQFFKNKHF